MTNFDDLAKFDAAFLGILQHCGKIEPFMEAFFFFLARKTDFFLTMKSREDKMGFPPGVAEKLTSKIFKKYQAMVASSTAESAQETTKPLSVQDDLTSNTSMPHVDNEVEVSSSGSTDVQEKERAGCSSSTVATKTVSTESEGRTSSNTEVSRSAIPTSTDCYNGAKTETYEWSQTATDVDIKIPLPAFARKSNSFKVVIASDHLDVRLIGPLPDDFKSDPILISGNLKYRVKCQESLWSFVPGKHIQVNLEKSKELWWTAVLDGEPEIDKTKIDTTRDISEFDEQTQQDFERVMFDHHQKQAGKPTIQEQKTYKLLEQAWDAEGSPFKGTPFDPSQVNVSPGSGL